MDYTHALSQANLRLMVRPALVEDLGAGDLTTETLIPADWAMTAELRSREDAVVAGMGVVRAIFAELDPRVQVTALAAEGQAVRAGSVIGELSGPARAILIGERTALNYLQRLCGVATLTRRYAEAIAGSHTKLLDTRKTTPGMRLLEKYAVAMGGGRNHRFGLHDRIMIKDNHLQLLRASGQTSLARHLALCRQAHPNVELEIEADTLEQVAEILPAGPDYLLLDNMDDEQLRTAVALRQKLNTRVLLEASGGMTLARLPAVAATGVDFISVGALTHTVRAIDIGLDMKPETRRFPDTR
jgi:nicotinate-nucleotide pyrophosphorylase (carboxylating)